MRLILLILLFPSIVNAACFLTKEQDQRGDFVVKCTKGFVPKDRLCRAPIKQGRFVIPEIVTRDSEGQELSRRPYSLGDVVDPEQGERVECSVDSAALQAWKTQRQNAQQAAQQLQAKRRKLIQDLRQNCLLAMPTRKTKASEWNTCMSAWMKKELAPDLFDELAPDALEFGAGGQ